MVVCSGGDRFHPLNNFLEQRSHDFSAEKICNNKHTSYET